MRKRSEIGTTSAGPVLPGEPDPWALRPESVAAQQRAPEEAPVQKGSSPRVSIPAGIAAEGTVVTVDVGKKTYCPVQFNPFRVVPFSVTAPTLPGEFIAAAMARLRSELAGVAEEACREESAQHLRTLRAVCDEAKR